ncbi:integral membrane protein [Cryptococcus neoformans]|uniref:Integral membrane protein n=2 Tax=Cryptococcus neoformans TaxID=5207 RepID=A0A854Q4V1_CRYNE|nr:integral membrane protein [Cryptococcus neoformans var. grubii H99]AUB28995.1 integral membrane protein [Cryptococcus neoformans var. grubii]OWT35575.1 integral membrane protein [Cryptococcus neoformans var. grubii Bt1]OWZ26610.1 integral membrane protein [Cryptococcus neoformans var. grubii AD1-83a]OWZ37408.1 integral membrane protein [Cryptococcus neoformans var. grubii AD2-60a]OWZ38368.1 integral membrane protein [Cryptococcus neoformans var. grubii C23]OXC81107.1 integral membrane prot|eukprot:XP_012053580.1 integral membrane protein [Cryptococcus neoformans var. grubii H99]
MVVTRRQAVSASSTPPPNMPETTHLLPKAGETSEDGERRTISYEESLILLPWQTDNDYIRHGYRRATPSIRKCLWSAVSYLHNETVNIHSHSVGAVFFLSLLPLHLIPTHFPTLSLSCNPLPTPPTLHDKLALALYLICAVSCLSLSSWFHTVSCHSKEVCDAAHRGDYIGIVILIVGSITPGMYYAFYENVFLQVFYMAVIIIAGIASAYIVLSPHHRSHRWHRTLTFIALGLSAVVPITHILFTQGLAHAREKMSLDLIVAGGASYIFGALLYAARIPEKLSPGTFDYFGSSHQIFHCFVLAGAGFQYAALRGMVWGRAMAVGKTIAGSEGLS